MKKFFCVIIFIFNIYLNLTVQALNLTHKSLPKNLTVILNYWQQINGYFAYNEKLPKECKIKRAINNRVLTCPAWVKVIINKNQLLSWQQEQKKNGFINLYLPKIGFMHEKAKITKIKKVIHKMPTNKNQYLVTTVYMRYARVLKYKIKDIDTAEISEITATPEHKFYETTYKKFMPISKLGSANTITNASHHNLKIICTNNRQNNCGTAPLNSLQKVYNMEVEKAHNYFVGKIKVLVHNGCYDYFYKCKKCGEIHANQDRFSMRCTISENERHCLRIVYQCEFCGLYTESKTRKGIHLKFHKEKNGEYGCSLCTAIFKDKGSLIHHMQMHEKTQNLIFCGECDKRISLPEKLSGRHSHKFYSQTQYTTESFFRARSRSPIKNFFDDIDFKTIDDILDRTKEFNR